MIEIDEYASKIISLKYKIKDDLMHYIIIKVKKNDTQITVLLLKCPMFSNYL